MSGAKLVAAVVSSGVSALLRKSMFVRKGLVFRRAAGGNVIQVVEVKMQRGAHPGEALLVLEVGTYLPRLVSLLHERAIANPREYDCTIRTRVGPRTRGNDPWWPVMPGEEARVGSLVVSALDQRVFPWLDLTSDPKKLSAALDHDDRSLLWAPNMLTPAALAVDMGKKTLAKQRLAAAEGSIRTTLAERAADFGKNDAFGSDVLKLAARLRKEHAL